MIGSYFAHYVSVGLCLVAMWCSIVNIWKIRILPKHLSSLVFCYIMFSLFTLTTFVTLQVSSILSGNFFHEDGTLWILVFEYSNAMSYIFGMVSLTIGLNIYHELRMKLPKEGTPPLWLK